MEFIWQAIDVVAGLQIIQPAKGTTGIISWVGGSNDGVTVTETNTDGMVWYTHEKDETGNLKVFEDELIKVFFTPEKLAKRLNNASYPWLPTAIFHGSGMRMLTDSRGNYHEDYCGLRNMDLKNLKK